MQNNEFKNLLKLKKETKDFTELQQILFEEVREIDANCNEADFYINEIKSYLENLERIIEDIKINRKNYNS